MIFKVKYPLHLNQALRCKGKFLMFVYNKTIKRQTTIEKNATPSIRAAATIMLERISPAASG